MKIQLIDCKAKVDMDDVEEELVKMYGYYGN